MGNENNKNVLAHTNYLFIVLRESFTIQLINHLCNTDHITWRVFNWHAQQRFCPVARLQVNITIETCILQKLDSNLGIPYVICCRQRDKHGIDKSCACNQLTWYASGILTGSPLSATWPAMPVPHATRTSSCCTISSNVLRGHTSNSFETKHLFNHTTTKKKRKSKSKSLKWHTPIS